MFILLENRKAFTVYYTSPQKLEESL